MGIETRHNPAITPKQGWAVREFYTHGMRLRFQATPNGVGTAGPPRKSYNSAAADTRQGGK